MSRRIAHSRARASHDERLTPEDQAQNKTDPKCGHDRLHRIFAHIIFAILLQGPDAHSGVVPSLSGLVAIILRHCRRRRFQIFGCAARMSFTALQFVLRAARRATFIRFFFWHDLSPNVLMVYGTIRLRTPSRKPFRIPLFKRNWSAYRAYPA